MAGNTASHNAGNVNSAEVESSGTTEVWRPKFQRGSKTSLNVALVRPLPRSDNSELHPSASPSQDHTPSAPVSSTRLPVVSSPQNRPRRTHWGNCTLICPFSFDLRDSMRRVAHEQKLERLRRLEESQLAMAVTFRANPVRKYKPLVLKVSTRDTANPRAPVSRSDH